MPKNKDSKRSLQEQLKDLQKERYRLRTRLSWINRRIGVLRQRVAKEEANGDSSEVKAKLEDEVGYVQGEKGGKPSKPIE